MMAAMDLGIAGRTCVVTGGSRGIGAATAASLRAEGARVLTISRGGGPTSDDLALDVTASGAVDELLGIAGHVDILVNNAGMSYARPLESLSEEDWLEQYRLHVIAPMLLMRECAPRMAERGWGRIVNVCSAASKRPSLTNAAYSVSKAAQLSLSRVFADAYAGRGVLVNAVLPGRVDTSLWTAPGGLAEQIDPTKPAQATMSERARPIPLGRFATAEEIAEVVVFLCSDRAGAVAGAAWAADGGMVPVVY
jgi:3-oxoacyl-[acyl-carrier protein] reductase